MTSLMRPLTSTRYSQDAGIAIGPILFVIAVLGILASAIAAGSGSFTAGSSTEGNRTKAAAMMEIGENLKVGFERTVDSAGIPFADVIINIDNTTASADIFSPVGGGINPPSAALAGNPASDKWYYPRGSVTGLGTGGSNTNQIAVLNVTQGVCAEINNKIFASTTVPSGDIGMLHVNQTDVAQVASGWPTALKGKAVGCVQNTNATAGYYFYQVMGIR